MESLQINIIKGKIGVMITLLFIYKQSDILKVNNPQMEALLISVRNTTH